MGYHISDGEARPCSAQPGNCPIGGQHFDNMKDAQSYAEKQKGNPLNGATLSKNKRMSDAEARKKAKELFEYAQNSSLARVREDLPGLYVVKYHNKVFYKNLWNEKLENCRGVVFDKDGGIVALPFTKIYNDRVEKDAPVINDNEPVTYARKVNGFMGALSFHNGEAVYSTTGSLTSDYVKMFKGMVTPEQEKRLREMNEGHTYLFEVVNAADPHIIPEEEGLYLLGSREKRLDSPVTLYGEGEAPEGMRSVPSSNATMGEVRAMSKTAQHEGFVVYAQDGRSVKIKSPLYLTTKFVARANGVKLTSPTAKERVEEEFYPLIDEIQSNPEAYTSKSETERLEWVREFLANQG